MQATIDTWSLLCSALDQQRARGLTGHELEFWVELTIGACKSMVKHRGTNKVETFLVNCLLRNIALSKVKRDHGFRDGKPYVGTLLERCPGITDKAVVRLPDHGDSQTGTQLLGSGLSTTLSEQRGLTKTMATLVQESAELWEEHFPGMLPDSCLYTKYKRAQLKGGEVLHSEEYRRITSRFSYFVTAAWEGEPLYIAKILYFVRVELLSDHAQDATATLRLAVCDLYTQTEIDAGLGLCHAVSNKDQKKAKFAAYAVNVEDLGGKVLWLDVARTNPGHAGDLHGFTKYSWLFIPYSHAKTYLDPEAEADASCDHQLQLEDEDIG